ncbi:MAG: hypothetical protein WAK82_41645 [Streptosporangiaceae bacterium]
MMLMPCRPVRMAVRARKAEREAPRVLKRGRSGAAFTDSPDGTLSPVTGSPFADRQMAPCWVEMSPDGQFLFAVNTASGTISRYSIAPGGALRLLGSTPVRASGGVGRVDARLGPGGRFLYVDESTIGAVGEFAVSGGNLTKLTGSRSPGPQAPPPQASSPTNPVTIASRELGSRPRLRGGYRRLLSATTGGVRNDRRRRSKHVPLTVRRSSPSQAATRSRGCRNDQPRRRPTG